MEHVVRFNAYVSNREHLPAYMKARDNAVGQLPPVASTLMIVDGFSRPEFFVEVEAVLIGLLTGVVVARCPTYPMRLCLDFS